MSRESLLIEYKKYLLRKMTDEEKDLITTDSVTYKYIDFDDYVKWLEQEVDKIRNNNNIKRTKWKKEM